MNTNENFIKAASLEREKLTSFYNQNGITKHKFTPSDSYHHFDSTFVKNDRLYIVEVKVRKERIDSSLFNTGYMLEKLKYDNLCALAEQQKEKNPTILYINFFEDGVITFNLSDRMKGKVELPALSTINCNKNTVVNTGKVNKKIYLLEVSQRDKKEYTTTVPVAVPKVIDETQDFLSAPINKIKQIEGTVKNKKRGLDATTSWFFGE